MTAAAAAVQREWITGALEACHSDSHGKATAPRPATALPTTAASTTSNAT